MKPKATLLDTARSTKSTSSRNRLSGGTKTSSSDGKENSGDRKSLARPITGSHRLTKEGIEFDSPDVTHAPDMTKPILNGGISEKRTARPTAPSAPGGQRSREINNLLGGTTRLQLKSKHVVRSVAFISNKGGVGKTHISTNMAFYLSRSGKKALLVDLDMGHADVTSKLGYYCDNTVLDLFEGRRKVGDLVYTTPHGFDLIAGESGDFKLANLGAPQRGRLIRAFRETGSDYDYVLYDLSAGIGATTLDFALAQDHQIIITTPQDIVAGYSCIKAAFHRFRELERKMADKKPAYQPRMTFRPFVVLNQVEDFDNGRELYDRIRGVINQNLKQDKDFKIDIYFLGVVTSDFPRIREAELSRFLYSCEYGASRAGQCMNFLVENLIRYRDPNPMTFTSKLRRFIDIFMKSVGEAKYAR